MTVSANFAFLQSEFPFVAESANLAEQSIHRDPRGACFHARHCLESLIRRIYKVDKSLTPPRVTNLDGYINGEGFVKLVPEAVWAKAEYVRQAGNKAVHGKKAPTPEDALAVMRELAHVVYWTGRTYLRKGAEQLKGYTYDESLIPTDTAGATASLAELEAIQGKLDAAAAEKEETDAELKRLQDELAKYKAENEQAEDTHDYNEAKTRELIIDLELARAGWPLDKPQDREYRVEPMPNKEGFGFADYVLWGDDGKPLAVVEAKRTTVSPEAGQQQAKLYADALEHMHGQRPLIYYTNGYTTWLWDDLAYPPRKVIGFYKKDELQRLIVRRTQRKALDVVEISDDIAGRYYQKRAITSIGQRFTQQHRKVLLVMATGTGKTRTAIALVDQLMRAGWVKRALFLADRVSLVNQAVGAFRAHLPSSSPVNLVTDKGATGRVYVSTYPTMMGLIDETQGNEAKFSVGHFDLVIIDEAHRSVYQKYGAIFRYFDSLLVGLTATPREQVDRNTYQLFGLEPGVPTDAYELETAVADGFLVPPQAEQVDLKFPGKGIEYDDLSEEEKEEWEGLDWGDQGDGPGTPKKVNAAAINQWLFNIDTVDKALRHLMKHGHKVEGGDRLAKTIIFARNHDHAVFIEERFNHHYPRYKGHFARVIDNYAKYPQSLIDDFSLKNKVPHIAISVDMMDTGIDVPEVANLVFFKPVYSKIKFWQMIGRGTRLCPDLFGPGEDKADFRIFDFCFNFDFFRENPDGIERGSGVPLGTQLFRSRVELLATVQRETELDPGAKLASSLIDTLHGEVDAMKLDNFIVRMEREAVTRFKDREVWGALSESDVTGLQQKIAGLPSEQESEDLEAKLFDLIALRMQLATAQGDAGLFESQRQRVVEIAMLLEEKSAVPAVKAQLGYLADLQTTEFWEGITLAMLEDMRLRLRNLLKLLDKKAQKPIYTNFADEVEGVRKVEIGAMPKMTGPQYEKRVKEYLETHQMNAAIHRLRNNHPMTQTDLDGLQQALIKIGEEDGETLLSSWMARSEAPSLPHFVRSLVGLDRRAAMAAFSGFLNDESLNPPQIRFVEMMIDQLTARGVMDASSLYEPPFSNLHAGGPDELFAGKDAVIAEIFEALESVQPAIQTGTG